MQVSNLVLQNEAFENGDTNAFPKNIVGSASKVASSSQKLVLAGKDLVNSSRDQVSVDTTIKYVVFTS